MRRDDQLGARLEPHQAAQEQPMPSRIEMELRFVDEDDPLPVLVQGERAEEEEQLELARAEQINLEAGAVGREQIDIETPDPGLIVRGDLHSKGLVGVGIDLTPGLVDLSDDRRVSTEWGQWILEALDRRGIHQELLDVAQPIPIVLGGATARPADGRVDVADEGGG